MFEKNLPKVVSPEEWLAARKELLVKEKELTRTRDRVNADRRRMPMVRVDKPYTFEGPDGTVGLLDLFEGRPQLVMHHFMWINDIDADGTERPRDTGAVREDRRVPRTYGVDVLLVLLGRQRLQLRLPRHGRRPGRAGADLPPHRGRARRGGNAIYGDHAWRLAGHQRIPPRRRRGLPHLLHVRPWRRRVPQRLPLPRPHRPRPPGGVGGAEGTRGPTRPACRRPRHAPPRRVRRGLDRVAVGQLVVRAPSGLYGNRGSIGPK